jgi:CheY-like chemotaxis protein
LRIKVTDNGVGIEPASLKKIFQPFEQAEATGNHRFGGMGLGLAIAHAIVEMHHGKIWAESDGLNKGATFEVEFPDATLPPRDAATRPSDLPGKVASIIPASLPAGALRHLLLVEDHAPTLKVLSSLLERGGYDVTTAGNIAEALKAASIRTFDLVVSDLGLPDGTGIQLMEKLRSEYGLRGVALSGYGMEDDIKRAREAGFVAHLVKPIRIGELKNLLAALN